MNRARKLISLLEAILNPLKVDYKGNYNGPLKGFDHTYMYGEHNKNMVNRSEENSVGHIHDELSKEARGHLEENSDPYDVTHRLQSGIDHYTSMGYHGMNVHLRQGFETSPTNEKAIRSLRTLTNIKTKHSFKAYRGVRNKDFDTTEGSTFKDKGFTSASLLPSMAAKSFGVSSDEQRGHNFVINIKKGTKGHYVSGHSFSHQDGAEREFVLHPGTTFRVGKTKQHSNGHTYTELHIHHQE